MSESILPPSILKMGDGKEFITKGMRILIECKEDDNFYEKTVLLKPESYKKYARLGWVRQFGDTLKIDNKAEDFGFDIGDQVYFNPYTGVDVDIDDKHYKLISPDELLCMVGE